MLFDDMTNQIKARHGAIQPSTVVIIGIDINARMTANLLEHMGITNYVFASENWIYWGSRINGKLVHDPKYLGGGQNLLLIAADSISEELKVMLAEFGYVRGNNLLTLNESVSGEDISSPSRPRKRVL